MCKFKRLWVSTGAYVYIAAAVLDVGRLETSPIEKIFSNFLCYSVLLSTSTYPAWFASSELDIDWGGF